MMQDSNRIRIFTRIDPFLKYVSCIIYFPRFVFNTQIRRRVEDYLSLAMNAVRTDSIPTFSQDVMVHTMVRLEKSKLKFTTEELEEVLNKLARSWTDELKIQCHEFDASRKFKNTYEQFKEAFPKGYQEKFHPSEAVKDICWLKN